MNVFLSSKADRQLKKLPSTMHEVMISRIHELARNPYPKNAKKLVKRPAFRIRVGDYRILYTIEKEDLIILSVAHRREVYR